MKFNLHSSPALRSKLRILKPIAKHHYFIVTVLVFSSVAVVIYIVNTTLNMPPDDEYKTKQLQSTIGTTFNQSARETIEKIKQLQKSTDAAGPEASFPSGRINPFAE